MIFSAFIYVFTLLNKSYAEWQLLWSDEFETNTLDENVWQVIDEETMTGNHIKQLNWNKEKNVYVKSGNLVIESIYDARSSEMNFTSGKILLTKSFTYGRFEVRAALPLGKMLTSHIYLIPEIDSNKWPDDGQIDIMVNKQSSEIISDIYYHKASYTEKFETNTNLNYYHNYSLEWNENEINWFFDDFKYMNITINKKLGVIYENRQPFDKPFRFMIFVGVGGEDIFPGETLSPNDALAWNDTKLKIECVKVYNWITRSVGEGTQSVLESSASRPDKHQNNRLIYINHMFSLYYFTITCILYITTIEL